MNKPIAAISVLILVFLGVAVGVVLWMQNAPSPQPPRPVGVPAEAQWLGDNKGEWIDCRIEKKTRNIAQCTRYNDEKGERVSVGSYRWESAEKRIMPQILELIAFDGEVITAKGGMLYPTGKHVFDLPGGDHWVKDYSVADQSDRGK